MVKKVHFKSIEIRGAQTHNLKNIDVTIPLNKITCIYGPSGSGKSSLAFHTLLAESKRRYLNSLPNDVKFFWNMPTAADVDSIYPVLPVWGLAQSNPILGSRPNLADTIGLSEYIQRLFYDFGRESCPHHKVHLNEIDWNDLFLTDLYEKYELEEESVLHFLVDRSSYEEKFGGDAQPVRSFDFESSSIRIFSEDDLYWELFRLKRKSLNKLPEKLKEIGIKVEDVFYHIKDTDVLGPLPQERALKCPKCDYQIRKESYEATEFSPYNAAGACQKCSGHGMNLEYDRNKVVKYPYLSIEDGAISILESSHFSHLYPYLVKELKKEKISLSKEFEKLPQKKLWKILEEGQGKFPGLQACYDYLDSKRYKRTVRIFSRRLKSEVLCEVCSGTRVNKKVHNLILNEKRPLSYKDIWLFSCNEIESYFQDLSKNSSDEKMKLRITPILNLLKIALDLDLSEIPLWRKAKFISSSEYQRALLTKILSYQGSGSLFILDEPSYDLSLESQRQVFDCLIKVKEQGNTILIVEHSEYLRNLSDYLIEMGPGAGPLGGQVISAKVNKKKLKKLSTPLGKTLKTVKNKIEVSGFTFQEKTFEEMEIPLGETSVIWGSSGSYKNYYFYKFLANSLSFVATGEPLADMLDVREDLIKGKNLTDIEQVIVFDSSVGKVSSRSTVGTTIGLSPELRKYFSMLPVAKDLALQKGHFSPNSDLGRCPTCEGKGVKEIEMSFLEDIVLSCDDCHGKKLKPFIANLSDGELTVHEAFNRPMSDVVDRLTLTPKYKKLWAMVKLLNLQYLSLGRPLSGLSGGERLRVKLLAQLSKKIENSVLLFDNVSSGLSSLEIEKIFDFIDSLKHDGNTVMIIDQNPVVLKRASHSIKFI